MEDSPQKKQKFENEKKKKSKTTKKQKKEGSSPETKFKNKEEIFLKRRRNEKYAVQEFNTKGICKTRFEIFNTFSKTFFY